MPVQRPILDQLFEIPGLTVTPLAPLSAYTRFAIGGPAALFCDTASESAFVQALQMVQREAAPHVVIGGGTNLVVSDKGFDGIALRYTGAAIKREGNLLHAQAGAVLQDVVDYSLALGLKGFETMTGIPGCLGGAIYGNAGAYGRSIHQMAEEVRFTQAGGVEVSDNEHCRFSYRDSIFKQNKQRVILSATLRLTEGDTAELTRTATEIRAIRDEKYPPTMKCAGSIFKNLLYAGLPPHVQQLLPTKVIREGKVPSAWFLEQVGVKGLRRGDIQVANYHANLVYNDGAGTASDLLWVIQELKGRVQAKFDFEIEEEVQYVGF